LITSLKDYFHESLKAKLISLSFAYLSRILDT
jgi:hypothetical protein